MDGEQQIDAVPGLRVARCLERSYANGPGARAVLWVQGCTLKCPGCFNPDMQAPAGGTWKSVEALFTWLVGLGASVEGLSLSGGEPLQQRAALTLLLQRVRRETALSVLLFTGYTWAELHAMPDIAALLACVDVLIAGRYETARPLGCGMLGSANQTVHLLTDRYDEAAIRAVPPVEVIITKDGDRILSGVDGRAFENF